ncbi:MAG: ribosomal protein S18-alanine N-acetyltransferase [Oscillospiraceae bacterium]|nr:ribosomal protein S18-alanine N-acetyltransferase [Oscillospiraceae bacterium]MBQ6902250.1 ribosomal protein S18-alanine N-acetyltransferase [Oscillospiraceae bacterium]
MMQKNNVSIRLAEKRDIPHIAELERSCFSSPWSETAIAETMERPESVFLVAEVCSNVCGYVGAYYVLDEGYITNIAVSPSNRRCGIGFALISELIKKGEALDLSFWTLEVRVSNIAAQTLYKKLGFESVGRRPRFYTNPCEDAELMTLYMGKERRQ